MFNLKKIGKMFSGYVGKNASREQLLEEERKSQGLSSAETPEIFESIVNKKDNDSKDKIIEGNLERKDPVDRIAESRMDDDLTYSVRSKEENREEVPRINVATEKWDQQYRDAFKKAQDQLDRQDDLFEKYMGKKTAKKVPVNVPESASGIPNRPERFVDFDGVPGADVKENLKNIGETSKVKPMHTIADLDAVKQLDAAAFYVTYKAASDGRDLNDAENSIIKSIIEKKRELLEKK